MESSRVTCPHCDFLFYPEEGVTVDDCPVCGRTVEVKPAPAPGATCKESLQVHALPDSVESALGVVILSDFPSVESVLRHHISDLTRRLAGAEAQLASREQELLDTLNRLMDERGTLRGKAEAAEARVRELERDNAGRFEHIVKVEAERDALRERCGRLEAALVEIGNSEDRICGYCEGEGNRYADGKAHYYSEHAPTIPCPECGGRGRIRDMDSEDMAAVANAALATEVKP